MQNNSTQIGLGVAQACAALGIGRTSLYELISQGKVKARKIGSRTIILVDDLQAYADSLPVVGLKLGGQR